MHLGFRLSSLLYTKHEKLTLLEFKKFYEENLCLVGIEYLVGVNSIINGFFILMKIWDIGKPQRFSNCGLRPTNSESPRAHFSHRCDELPRFPLKVSGEDGVVCILTTTQVLTCAHMTLRMTEGLLWSSIRAKPTRKTGLDKSPWSQSLFFRGRDCKFYLKSFSLIMLFWLASLVLSALSPFLTTCIWILSSLHPFCHLLKQVQSSYPFQILDLSYSLPLISRMWSMTYYFKSFLEDTFNWINLFLPCS